MTPIPRLSRRPLSPAAAAVTQAAGGGLSRRALLGTGVAASAGLALPTARLHYAYAEALHKAGIPAEARHWFASAAGLDRDQETDAQQRVDELDGFLIDFDDDELERVRLKPCEWGRQRGE